MNAEQTFRSKSSGIVAKLLGDFPIRNADAFAIVGNLGHECAGFTKLQEIAPSVKGSRGGYGWAQWTGPRRRAFEAYCARTGQAPTSDEANYAWLFLELKGAEARAIPAVLDVDGPRTKVEAFERSYLRAGVKHYDGRLTWCRIAENEWSKSGQAPAPLPVERKREILVDEAEASRQRAGTAKEQAAGSSGGAVASSGGAVATPDFWADLFLCSITIGLIGLALWLGWRAYQQSLAARRLADEATKLPEVPHA